MNQDSREELITWLTYARNSMRKRVWVPVGEKPGPQKYAELPDGAVPVWWIDQEIKRLKDGRIDYPSLPSL